MSPIFAHFFKPVKHLRCFPKNTKRWFLFHIAPPALLNTGIMAVNSTVANFISKAGTDDVARNNLFRVMSLRIQNVIELTEDDLLYCKGGQIPGRTNPVHTLKFMGMEMPYPGSTVKYEGNQGYTLKFYVDKNSSIAKKFEAASRIIFNEITSTGKWNFPQIEDTLTIAALGFDLEPIEYITFHGVSFGGFESISFDTAGGDGSDIEISVKINFIYYRRDNSAVTWISK